MNILPYRQISVVLLGIVVIAVELQQNTNAIKSQTRDSLTEKQMEYISWQANNPELVEAIHHVNEVGYGGELDPIKETMYRLYSNAVLREWENSFYQYEQGLFSEEDFQARRERWRRNLADPSVKYVWEREQATFSPSFRAEVNDILANL